MHKKKKAMLLVLTILSLILLPFVLFMALSPQLGGSLTKQANLELQQSPQFRDGKFTNTNNETVDMSGGAIMAMVKEQFKTHPNTTPTDQLPVLDMDSTDLANYNGEARLFWFGHSTFLLQAQGKTIIIDPMFGETASPVSFLGVERFNKHLPIDIEKLPKIDAILISHDHYDHLDYASIQKLKAKTDKFYTPLGVGAHLEVWGVEKARIQELDWWQSISFDQFKLVCTPAQHFSGRGKWLSDRASTLWCSWIIKTPATSIFFSGDSGYGEHFKTIGAKYGPFDLALMECGQYNTLWKGIHMMPEETIQAGKDVDANAVMPMHWGAFKLAMHEWNEPIERATKAAKLLDIPILSPIIGEELMINEQSELTNEWW